jgi:AcrR family transcriptional regulator
MTNGDRRAPVAAVDGVQHLDAGNPRTARRRAQTRRRLLDAARVVFEHDGYHDARLADIVKEAGLATGTFYNYYPSKEAIFRDLVTQVIADLVDESGREPHQDDPIAGIYAANRAYVAGYRRNARMMSLLLQLGPQAVPPDLGIDVHNQFETKVSRAIEHWQREGLVYADLDPVYAANALSYMVDRFLYEWTVLDLDYDEDKVVETLSKLWVRGLGLERPGLNGIAHHNGAASNGAARARRRRSTTER